MIWYILIPIIIFAQDDFQTYAHLQRDDPELLFNSFDPVYEKLNKHTQNFMFITPWNQDGKKYALKYTQKLDYISPCWYELNIRMLSSGVEEIIIEHQSNYDKNFLMQLKQNNPNIKVLPRLYLPADRFTVLQKLSNQVILNKFMKLVQKISKLQYIDGFVWDTPFSRFQSKDKSLNQFLVQLVKGYKQVLKKKLLFMNMANPEQGVNKDLSSMKQLQIDGLMIQNYGQKGYTQCILNSKKFVQKLKLSTKIKIIFILPFFSLKNNNQMISTGDALKQLEQHGLDSCYFDQICIYQSGSNTFRTPCYNYFTKSRQLSEPYGIGFWEGGNGLQIYYSFI